MGTEYKNGYIAGYVHLFSNVENGQKQIVTGDSQKLVINLAGYTFTDPYGYKIGGSSDTHPEASLTVKNGTINMTGSSNQIQPRCDVTLIYDNVVMIVDITTRDKNFIYGDCADYTLFRNSLIINKTGTNFYISSSFENKGTARSEFRLENTEIVYTVAPVGPVFDVRESSFGTCYWDFYFDKDSAIIGDVPCLFRFTEGFEAVRYPFLNTQNVYIEEGFTTSLASALDFTALFVAVDNAGTGKPAVTLTASGEEGSVFNMILVKPGTTEACDNVYLVEGKFSYTVYSEIPEGDYAYSYKPLGSPVAYVMLARRNAGGDVIITCDDIKSMSAGAVITFLCDIIYDSTGSPNADGRVQGYQSGLTFDLNGNTFYFSGYRWYVTSTITFKNGAITVENTDKYVFFGNPGAESILTLDNIDLTVTVSDSFTHDAVIELYSGALVIKGGSNIQLPMDKYLVMFTETAAHTFMLEDSSITAAGLVKSKYVSGLSDSYTVKNSTLNLSSMLLAFDGTYSGNGDRISVSIENSSIKSLGMISAPASLTSPIYSLSLSEIYLTVSPEISESVGSVVTARGERIMQIEHDTYAYRVTVAEAKFKANLLLESDFSVRFMIPVGSNIVALEIDGVLYTVEELTETVVYDGVTYKLVAVKGIMPNEAQDAFALNVVFTKDGIKHTLISSYSVLDYLDTLLNDTDYSRIIKNLGVATLDYIAAAYRYTDKPIEGALAALLACDAYTQYKPEAYIPGEAVTGLGTATDAISSAQLDLGASMKIRFNLNGTFSGKLTVNGTEYNVQSGKVGELAYIEVSMPAYELYDSVITISGENISGSYSLVQYATSSTVTGGSDNLKLLISAFYTYCGCADRYVSASNVK